VTALQIDTEASRHASSVWASWADHINAAQMQIGRDIEPLGLARAATVCTRIAGAATELWTVSGFLTLLVEQLEALDGGAPRLDESALDDLMWLAGGSRGSAAACPAEHYSGVVGEPGDTFLAELRSPYDLDAADQSELGRQLVMRALRDTADSGQIRKDEFEIVRLSDGRFLVALPGVIDLTHPGLGFDHDNRSVRDLDRSAWNSSMSASLADNAYARMVWDALIASRVPQGSELVIVGHSFGADTALDLAADPRFNGPTGYDVTHVVAAGYDSRSQLDAVPGSTHVLVLQNRGDVPVLAESVGHTGVTNAIDDVLGVATSGLDFDAGGMLDHGLAALSNSAKAGASLAGHVADRADDVAVDMAHLRPLDAVEDAVFPLKGTEQHGSQVVSTFDSGWTPSDGGHDQDRYIDFVEATSDPLVLGFFGSLATGAAVSGTAVAVDVSVPEKKKDDAQKT